MIKYIEQKRQQKGIIIRDLCTRVGIHDQTYYNFKYGKGINYKTLLKILKELDISLCELEKHVI